VLDALGHRLELTNGVDASGVDVDVSGRLRVGARGDLVLAGSLIDVQTGGFLSLVGSGPSARGSITGDGVGGWEVEIGSGATLEAQYFRVQEMGTAGILVDINASLGAFPLDVRDGIFDLIAANGVYLESDRQTPTQLDELQFRDTSGVGRANQPGTKNVRVSSSRQIVSFEGWSGAFGGPLYEDDASGLALWGSRIAYLIVREHAARNDVFWRTVFEDDVLSFHVERAPAMTGSFVQVGPDVTPVGPSLYSVSDATITAATPYRYRLREVLYAGPPEISKVLRTVKVDGLPNPAGLPGKGPLTPLPLAGLDGPGGGKLGKLKGASPSRTPKEVETEADGRGLDLPELLAAALADEDERWIEIELPAGRHAAFTYEPTGRRHLRITAQEGEPAVIDVTQGPIRIRGVGAGLSVELAGFELRADDSRMPARVIEDCAGIVLLDRLEVHGTGPAGIRVTGSQAVVLQGVKLPELARVELTGSTAWCRGGRLNELAQSEVSRVESWGTRARSDVDGTSEWLAHETAPARLDLEELEGELFLTVEGTPGTPWLGLAGLRLRRELPRGSPPLLIERPMELGPAHVVGPDGRDQLALAIPPSLALLPGAACHSRDRREESARSLQLRLPDSAARFGPHGSAGRR
jgi:hypothetical protein